MTRVGAKEDWDSTAIEVMNERAEKKRRRWFFRIRTEQDALDALKICWQGFYALAAIMAVLLAIFGMTFEPEVLVNFLDVLVMVGLARLIQSRQSRTATIALVLYAGFIFFVTLANRMGVPFFESSFGGRNIVLGVIAVYCAVMGAYGAFRYHRLRGSVVVWRNVLLLALLLLVYNIAAIAGVIATVLFIPSGQRFLLSDAYDPAWDSIIGALLVALMTLVTLAGALRHLPGTRRLHTIELVQEKTEPFPLVYSSTTNGSPPPDAPSDTMRREASARSTGYFQAHWRGELSLARSYWINGVLLTALLRLTETVVGQTITRPMRPGSALLALLVLEVSILVGITVWQLVGIWRSAARYKQGPGPRFWATVAQGLVVLGGIGTIVTVVNYGQLSWRTVQIMSGNLMNEYSVQVVEETDIHYTGYINYRAVDEIREQLSLYEHISVLVINSPGGFIGASIELASLVKEYELLVIADGQCMSGCTLPLIASSVPAVVPGTVIGFHRAGDMNISEFDDASAEMMEDFYITHGLDIETLSLIMSTPNREMWMPSLGTLVERGIIRHVFDVESWQLFPADQWCAAYPSDCS